MVDHSENSQSRSIGWNDLFKGHPRVKNGSWGTWSSWGTRGFDHILRPYGVDVEKQASASGGSADKPLAAKVGDAEGRGADLS